MVITTATPILVALCVANVLCYMFNSLVPAAPVEFQAFIQQTLEVPSNGTGLYFGLLESVFIGTASVAVLASGYLAKSVPTFRLLSIGLITWCVAVVLCGLAHPANNYYVLLVGRVLSGIGDSTVQSLVPTFIDRYASPQRKSFWIGMFFGGAACGTGLSYFVGSLVTRTLGWHWSFFVCAIMMVPSLFVCCFCVPSEFNQPLEQVTHSQASTSMIQDIKTLLTSSVFVASSLGGAAYDFAVFGVATYGPAIMIGSGTFSPAWCTTVFGVCVVFTGIIGSPLGGIILDRAARGNEENEGFRLVLASRQQFLSMLAAVPFLFLTSLCLQHSVLFVMTLILGLASTFLSMSANTVTVLLSAPASIRGLAVGLASIIRRGLGDVPSPILVGVVKDWLAPGCGSEQAPDGTSRLSPLCSSDENRSGLRLTLQLVVAWLGWCLLLWFITWRTAAASSRISHEEYKDASSPDVTS